MRQPDRVHPTIYWLVLVCLLSCSASPPRASQEDRTTPPDWHAVERVIDGDTLHAARGGVSVRVRLKGVNAPERGECVADRATEALRVLTSDGVRVESFGEDRYGRTLAYLWTAEGVLVQEKLVARGLALFNDYGDPGPMAERLSDAQRRAEQQGLGLFDRSACGSESRLDVRIASIDANPAGDDLALGAGESITLRGPAGADLGGWQIKDTSASHRIDLPPGTTLDHRGRLRVFSSCGDQAIGRYFACKKGSAIWNNTGDTAFLLNPNGSIVATKVWVP